MLHVGCTRFRYPGTWRRDSWRRLVPSWQRSLVPLTGISPRSRLPMPPLLQAWRLTLLYRLKKTDSSHTKRSAEPLLCVTQVTLAPVTHVERVLSSVAVGHPKDAKRS